jgi:WD40 repeat protein
VRLLDPARTFRTDFSADGKLLATSHDADVKLWDVSSGKLRITLKATAGRVAAISPDGKLVATAGDTIRLWDAATAREVRRLDADGFFKRFVHGIAFSGDGKRLASAEGSSPILWDVATGKQIATFAGHDWWKKATAVGCSADGKWLASRGGDGAVKLWEVASGKERFSLTTRSNSNCLAFSPDGRTLASAGGELTEEQDATGMRLVGFDLVPLWDVATGKELAVLAQPDVKPAGSRWAVVATSVAFSRDGKTLLTATNYGVHLWNLEQGPARNK